MQGLSYRGYRFLPASIQHAVWLYLRFTLSFRDFEDLVAKRGIAVSHETISRWWRISVRSTRVGCAPGVLRQLGDGISTRYLPRSPVGQMYLWRAIDDEGRYLTFWSNPDATRRQHCA